MPEISVVVPTYNRVAVLPAAIASILRQTVPVHEILVVDDGSTDGTREAVAALAGPVRYFYQSNAGPAAARNRGMREARGEWIAFQDSDDLWVTDKIAAQTAFLEKHPHLDFIFADLSNFSGDAGDAVASQAAGEPEILDPRLHAYLRAHGTRLDELFRHLLQTNPIPTPTVLFRRACLDTVGGFDESLRCCEDYDLWLRFAWQCQCGYLDRVLVRRRMHATNLIHDYSLVYERLLSVLKSLPARLGDVSTDLTSEIAAARTRTHFRLGSWYFSKRRWREAQRHLQEVRFAQLAPDFRSRALFVIKRSLSPLLAAF